MKKSIRKGLIFLIALIAVCGVFYQLLFWNSSYVVPNAKLSTDLLTKVVKSQSTGTLELNNEELNSIIKLYIDKKSFGDLTIKGVHCQIIDEKLKFLIPISYKGEEFLFTSTGTVNINNNAVDFIPQSFYIGKLPLPKGYILDKLNTISKGNGFIKDSKVHLNISNMPIKVTKSDIKDSKLILQVSKFDSKHNEKLKLLEGLLKYLH